LFDDQSEVVLILPPGVAHGFQSLTPATIGYATSSHWQPNLDTGVNPLSIGIEWPIGHGLISERDNLLPNLFDWEKHLMQMEVGLES
jgi:dTDP-4-dehydrorhamnose 3,5-epimerase